MKFQLEAIKYWIADHLLNSELDDAYHAGLREGADYANHKISMSLQEDIELTKTQKLGYDIAMNRFSLTRDAVNERLGIQK